MLNPIITPIDSDYINTKSLKIKRPELNTCDFYCKHIGDNVYAPYVQMRDKQFALRNITRVTNSIDGMCLFSTLFRNVEQIISEEDIDGKIFECQFNNDHWIPVRERNDKVKPNSYYCLSKNNCPYVM